jgi:hypothetical protein
MEVAHCPWPPEWFAMRGLPILVACPSATGSSGWTRSELRSRLLVRAWDYRQRHHARGVWFRLRRTLADASEAFAISAEEGRQLVAEGHEPMPVGNELNPPRQILFVSAERVHRLATARPLVVRLSAELLAADWIALVRFPRARP